MIQRLSVCIKPVIDPSPFYESKKKENFIFPLFFSRSNDISRRNSCEERGGREKTVALIHRGSRRLINHLRLRDVWGEWMRARLKMWWGGGARNDNELWGNGWPINYHGEPFDGGHKEQRTLDATPWRPCRVNLWQNFVPMRFCLSSFHSPSLRFFQGSLYVSSARDFNYIHIYIYKDIISD